MASASPTDLHRLQRELHDIKLQKAAIASAMRQQQRHTHRPERLAAARRESAAKLAEAQEQHRHGGVVTPEGSSNVPCGFKTWSEIFKHVRPGRQECEERRSAFFDVYRALIDGLATELVLDTRPDVSGGRGICLCGSEGRGTNVSRDATGGLNADQDIVVYIQGFDPQPECYAHYLQLFKAALQQGLSPQLRFDVKKKSLRFRHGNFSFDVLAGGAVTEQRLLEAASSRERGAERIRKNLKPSVSMRQVMFIRKKTKALLGHQKGDYWVLPDMIRVAKFWAHKANILKGRGRMIPYLIELLMVRAMEDVRDTWPSPTERLWSIEDCPRIWRRFLELLTEYKDLEVHWNPSLSHKQVKRSRLQPAADANSGSAGQRRRVPMADERPFVLDPANPTNNVAYHVSSSDPIQRAWITISRAARRELGAMALPCTTVSEPYTYACEGMFLLQQRLLYVRSSSSARDKQRSP